MHPSHALAQPVRIYEGGLLDPPPPPRVISGDQDMTKPNFYIMQSTKDMFGSIDRVVKEEDAEVLCVSHHYGKLVAIHLNGRCILRGSKHNSSTGGSEQQKQTRHEFF